MVVDGLLGCQPALKGHDRVILWYVLGVAALKHHQDGLIELVSRVVRADPAHERKLGDDVADFRRHVHGQCVTGHVDVDCGSQLAQRGLEGFQRLGQELHEMQIAGRVGLERGRHAGRLNERVEVGVTQLDPIARWEHARGCPAQTDRVEVR